MRTSAPVGAADPGPGQPGQLGGGRAADGGRAGPVGHGAPQVGGERGQGQPAVAGLAGPFDLDVAGGELGEEPGWQATGTVAADRRDDQVLPGPRHGHVEERRSSASSLEARAAAAASAAVAPAAGSDAASASSSTPSRDPRSRKSGQVSS